MLTALSVAHDCSMIDGNDSVIHLTVLPPVGSRPPHIEYTYTAVRKPESVRCFLRLLVVRLSGGVLTQSSLWGEVQTCIWSS